MDRRNGSSLRKRLYGVMIMRPIAGAPWLSGNVLLILAAFFFCQLSRQFTSVLIQYCSYKFNWDYAQASYLLPLRAGINLVVLFAILPRLTHLFVNQRGFRGPQSDKYITVMSGTCLVVGSLLIYASAHPWVLILGQIFIAIGSAFTVTARSFLTAIVDSLYLTLLYPSVTAVTNSVYRCHGRNDAER
ncbi:hypothetical protein B0I37DRAFT_411445 [Chaetomium sp. MPI-CAGE-AT-0009]|nr:hypothetical protein B0I37DRAFT_411445 [Chaetomium sp. MPI-CAGE-AT-0009]